MVRNIAAALCVLATVTTAIPGLAQAGMATPLPGTKVIKTDHSYKALVDRLMGAIKANKMGIVARASATNGAKSIGVKIAGNMVIMVFRPDFAVRMLKASVPAGIEAPLRWYVTEGTDGRATLTYRTPTAVFAPYKNSELAAMARELDAIFSRIEKAATGK